MNIIGWISLTLKFSAMIFGLLACFLAASGVDLREALDMVRNIVEWGMEGMRIVVTHPLLLGAVVLMLLMIKKMMKMMAKEKKKVDDDDDDDDDVSSEVVMRQLKDQFTLLRRVEERYYSTTN